MSDDFDDSFAPMADDFDVDAELELQRQFDEDEFIDQNEFIPPEMADAQNSESQNGQTIPNDPIAALNTVPKPRSPMKRSSEAIDSLSLDLTTELSASASASAASKKSRVIPAPASPPVPPRIYIFTRAPITGEFISFTDPSGKLYYLTQSSESSVESEIHGRIQRNAKQFAKTGGLLGEPIRELIRRVEEYETRKAIENELFRRRMSEKFALEAVEMEEKRDGTAPPEQKGKKHAGHELWVDKYRPRQFTELLSPERLNREILSWIKEWDQCVFGREKSEFQKAREERDKMKFQRFAQGQGQGGNNRPGGSSGKDKDSENDDPRPDYKILLLCGPAGLGKTSLAHMLSRLAGYNPMEINASEDRNEEILTQKIRSAVEMKAGMFGGNKPNLLILDEIDGVAGGEEGGDSGAIQALIKIVTATGGLKKKKDKDMEMGTEEKEGGAEAEEQEEAEEKDKDKGDEKGDAAGKRGAGKGKKDELPYLKRPIIAICNDPYAPALRPLRSLAKIFTFDRPLKSRLVDRLKFICQNEARVRNQQQRQRAKHGSQMDESDMNDPDINIPVQWAEEKLLNSLCDLVENDIRSALNTLQFIFLKGEKLTRSLLYSLQIGQKDFQRNRFDLVEKVWYSGPINARREAIQYGLPGAANQAAAKDSHSASHVSNPSGSLNGNGILNSQQYLRFQSLWDAFSDPGENSKLVETVHWNYLQQYYNDPTFSKTVDMSEWFSYCDQYADSGASDGEFLFSPYFPTVAILVALQCSKNTKPKLELSPGFQLMQAMEHGKNLLKSFLHAGNRLTTLGMSRNTIVLEYLSPLQQILSPNIRPVNLALLNQQEKHEFEQLIDTLIELGLTYKQDFLGQNAFHTGATHNPAHPLFGPQFLLEPPIDQLVKLDIEADSSRLWVNAYAYSRFSANQHGNQGDQRGMSGSPSPTLNPRPELPNKVKQFVLRELEFEIMRRQEAKRKAFAEAQRLIAQVAAAKAGPALAPIPVPVVRVSTASAFAAATVAKEEKEKEKEKSKQRTNFLQDFSNQLKATQMKKVKEAALESKRNTISGLTGKKPTPTPASSAAPASAAASAVFTSPSKIGTTAASTVSPLTAAASMEPAIHFRFHEGFTQAVRRSVPIAHFI